MNSINNKSLCKLISRKIFQVGTNVFTHQGEKFTLAAKFSSNQLFCDFFSKNVGFTKFLQKKYDSHFL